MQTNELGALLYQKIMANMKSILELEEMSYREQGRNDPRYKTFKKYVMDKTYSMMRDVFGDLADLGVLEETDYEEDVKNGYQNTPSCGSGYINTSKFLDFINKNSK